MKNIYAFQSGDRVECGVRILSVHLTLCGAMRAAEKFILDENNFWVDSGSVYLEDAAEVQGDIVKYWQRQDSYDIAIVTKMRLCW